MTVTSLCAGILLVGVVIFIFIYLFIRERLYLAMVFICMLGCLFAASELGIIASYLVDNAPLGRQFHRLQGLAAIFFLFGIPYLLYHLLELNIQWKRVNRYLPAVGLCIALFMSAAAFVSPDFFISQDESKKALLNLRWSTVRGQTGVFYNIRDILLSVTMLYLLVCMLGVYHRYLGDAFTVECPTGSGVQMTLAEVADELSRRLTGIFLEGEDGTRPVFGGYRLFQEDRAWHGLIPFHEYFHGDTGAGIGASHQTGWTGLVADLIIRRCRS